MILAKDIFQSKMVKMMPTDKKHFHEEFAEKIIAMLEKGTAPWQQPWTPAEYLAPRNPQSGTVYQGINRLNLSMSGYADPRWMTFKQANEAGYKIKRGSHATDIVFYKYTKQIDKTDENGDPVLDENGKPEKINVRLERPVISFAQVFNASQIEGIPPLEKQDHGPDWNSIERAEKILENSGAKIVHDQANRNFYRINEDTIHLTPKSSFDAPDKYYATALHELGHWTGNPFRLNREFGPFGSEKYAREELRAEISSWMTCQDLGIGHDPGQHAAYVNSWIQVLKKNPMEIVLACRDAEKIKDYVLGLEKEKEQDKQQKRDQEIAVKPEIKEPAKEKTFLHVPYAEKNLAKAYGAKWDRQEKLWYAPEGTDLAPLKKWQVPPVRETVLQENLDPRQEFAQKLTELGLDLKGELPIMDGSLHRVPVIEKQGRGMDGAYCLHSDGRPAGWAQNYVTGEKENLVASGVVLSPAERERQRIEAERKHRLMEIERQKTHEQAAIHCQQIWDQLAPADPEHPYLREKGVPAFGLKQDSRHNLVVPLQSIDGDLRGLQTISPDGQKFFNPGIEKKGNFYLIGAENRDLAKSEIVFCEGYATGASLHMATKQPVAVAFDAGNLEIVAMKIREKFPQAQITICADNDHGLPQNSNLQNVGVEKAQKAAKLIGAQVKIPMFTKEEKTRGLTDFNDLHKARGLQAVQKQLGVREQDRGMER